MASIEYCLYRVKFIRPSQKSFLHDNRTPGQIFLEALTERPSAEVRAGYTWHIGNIKLFERSSGYFAVGRTNNATIEKFDEESGNFLEEQLATSPYTHCVFNSEIGFIGIARKNALAPTTKGVAHRIEELLGQTRIVAANDITVEVAPIPDPDGFLRAIKTAYKVFKFSATFKGPNPFDADEYFQKPLSVYLNAAEGEKGKAQIQGHDLNREVVQEVARSTAATGNEASARIAKTKHQKPITINLKGDPSKRRYDDDAHDPAEVLIDLTELYMKVRGHAGDQD